MPTLCKHQSHVWTVETKGTLLTPALDLLPGRRCRCGVYVIIDADPRNVPGDSFKVAMIHSVDAECWAASNPALKTW